MRYDRRLHAAASTTSYVFGQLIPYIGNKRKLLDLIAQAVAQTGTDPRHARFLDAMAGSGVVSRWAKESGFEVVCNDWEPYSAAINGCYIACNAPPVYANRRSYDHVIGELNALAPADGWVTEHLCPRDDANPDVGRERMFYMRKNGQRIDAVRSRIAEWDAAGHLSEAQRHCLIAPLLYQACYTSNTSGVFKGFHRGWGGQTGTALSRIASDMRLSPAVFFDNGRRNQVFRADAADLAASPRDLGAIDVVYLDPPYNQHPYGSNYHVLNTVTLWDHPLLEPTITRRGDKSAIRQDWRTRRSPYNRPAEALAAHERLLAAFDVPWIATSYSTDGNIDLLALLRATVARGDTRVFLRTYKRYRVSAQRASRRPVNVEFVLLTRTSGRRNLSPDALAACIRAAERAALAAHAKAHTKGRIRVPAERHSARSRVLQRA
jgi:adenine-specific DNA-methyltransferase